VPMAFVRLRRGRRRSVPATKAASSFMNICIFRMFAAAKRNATNTLCAAIPRTRRRSGSSSVSFAPSFTKPLNPRPGRRERRSL
jgi:hypothetical protein